MFLQQLIERLELCKQDTSIQWDFGNLGILGAKSWRGLYRELALGHAEYGTPGILETVADVVADLKSCDGKTFTGYKGGDYVMDGTTRVYCDNWGRYSSTHIVGVLDLDYVVVLETRHVPV